MYRTSRTRKRDKAFRMDAPYRYERNTFIHDVLGVSGNGSRISHSTGERQTITINAINHTNSEVGVPASLDLSSGMGFWDPILTGSQISAGVNL